MDGLNARTADRGSTYNTERYSVEGDNWDEVESPEARNLLPMRLGTAPSPRVHL